MLTKILDSWKYFPFFQSSRSEISPTNRVYSLTEPNDSDDPSLGSFHPPVKTNDASMGYTNANDPFDDHHLQGFYSAASSTFNLMANDSLHEGLTRLLLLQTEL